MTHFRNFQLVSLSCDPGHVKCQTATTDLGGMQAGRQPARQQGRQALSKAMTFWERECEILADICGRGVHVCACVLAGDVCI